jgi:hypothetical protein
MEGREALIDVACRGLLVHLGKLHVNGGRSDRDRIGGNGPLIVGAFDMILNGNRPSPPPAPVTLTFSDVGQTC